MKILKTLFLTISLSIIGFTSSQAQTNTKPYETPVKTICIKHPLANDPVQFFSNSTALSFEVYKPGDIGKIIEALKKDENVKDCQTGTITGDYHQLTLLVKTQKDKAWYSGLFKKVGLNTIKINNNPIVAVEKM